LPQPLPLTLGADVAGIVEAVGSRDSPFAVGDAVFGATNPRFTGANAHYALALTRMLAHKPRRCDFLESAAVPVVAVTARQMLFRDARVRRGDRVLIQGAAGNVGAYAVQFARAAGAHVIASVLPKDKDEVLRLGADEVISIPSEEAQGLRGTVDAAIDTVGGKAQKDLFAFVRKGGTLISSVSAPDAQQLVVRIGQVLPLEAAREAHEMLERLRALPAGKLLLNAPGGSSPASAGSP
jgi:NADPH:quinone reductase-like Zn-dependent oxidoreductase